MGLFDRVGAVKSLTLLASLLCAFLLGGCASLSLPSEESIFRYSPTTEEVPPSIVGARRQLTAKESRSVMERLKRHSLPTDILERHITVEEAVSGVPLVLGNRVTLLIDAPATYAAMFKAIENAKDHINFESFIFSDDEIGRSFANLLLQKSAEGVRVNLIYDGYGSIGTSPTFFEHLRHGGVKVLAFNPINPLKLLLMGRWSLIHRDHRKILVVDGSVAFTGGENVSSFYSRSASGIPVIKGEKLPWRDTDVQIEGPAVVEFQKLFLDTWKRQKGEELPNADYFPQLKHEGHDLVRVIDSTWGRKNRTIYMTYLSAITFASDTIHLTNAYFVPDKQTMQALTDAARRKVDVKIILPSQSDSKFVLYATRSHYSRLLKSGVKLYERRNALLHAKTAVIDGVWSTVGSSNMDLWSFLRNNEVNAVIFSPNFADQMEAMFQKDLDDSEEISSEKWERRSLGERMMELFSRPLAYWL
jgi:cardiolipin synthase A/B